MRIIYVCLGLLLAPVLPLFFLWRGLREPGYRRHIGERYGFGPPVPPGGVWVHGVSAGEVQVACALLKALHARHPGLPLLVTTTTPIGRARAQALLGDTTTIRYAPLDLPFVVARFLARARPRALVIVETELWPNLFRECRRRGVPLVLASARVSARSVQRYRRFASLFGDALAHDVSIGAQSDADAQRFVEIGADPARVRVAGNLKFDFALPADVPARAARLRERLGDGRPVWVAGSTHEGEEDVLLAAHERIRRVHADALLVLVPRRPERFEAVAAALRRRGIATVRRSSGEAVRLDTAVLLVDVLGELLPFYGAGDVAFVGGSLVPVGGHNLLEPAALAKPILSGPHTQNAVGIADLFLQAGAAHTVHDDEQLAARVTAYMTDPASAARDGRAALAAMEANRGALARVVEIVEPLLQRSGVTSPRRDSSASR